MKVRIWQPNFSFRKYLFRKKSSKDFPKTPYKNSPLDVFSDVKVIYYRKIDGSSNLVHQFQVSEVVLSIKNGPNDFLQTRYKNFFLDAFSNVLDGQYRKIDGIPNLVAQFQVSEVHVQKDFGSGVVAYQILIFFTRSFSKV